MDLRKQIRSGIWIKSIWRWA